MTPRARGEDPHRPFRRPRPGDPTFAAPPSTPPPGLPEHHGAPTDAEPEVDRPGHAQRPGRLSALIVGLLAVVVALVLTLVLLQPHAPGLAAPAPSVVDFATAPEIAWAADGGHECQYSSSEDHAILSEVGRVWSLDLQTGDTLWDVDLPGHWGVTCLPGAHLVAALEYVDKDPGPVLRATFFDAATGAQRAELSDTTLRHVVPIGAMIGLVDDDNVLTAVEPDDLATPIWSRQLPGSPAEADTLSVRQIDDATLQIHYSTGDGYPLLYTSFFSMADGRTPSWVRGTATDLHFYTRVGDVVVWDRHDEEEGTTVLDLRGRELWKTEVGSLTPLGAHLYRWAPPTSSPDSGVQELREVDPRTGSPLTTDVFESPPGWVYPLPQGNLGVLHHQTLTFLDRHLHEVGTMPADPYAVTLHGTESLYIGENMYESGDREDEPRIVAIDPSDARTVWTLELNPGQELHRMGRHLIVRDGDATLHGLMDRP
ncbi:outer membrane protein assembly factor BamB family protein [Tessaracoccus antarcticus]|uniref:Pyrrolo-quinoline quinone repeat domain-containing protein n=1 Tax=Tessaracoccus antarcticus TaxID=2479848 RepID=A0A3M0G596_9ACTN|nr:PQQ-binding-like beta-propeller repeat protein [Tessaracoccus antarcticus]RMB60014.1 hypothetical protein EAX62_09885 [Tessaracoccus antarcticus]